MFKQIAALLRPKSVEPVAVADSVELKRKPTVKKATTRKFAAKPTVKKTVAKKK